MNRAVLPLTAAIFTLLAFQAPDAKACSNTCNMYGDSKSLPGNGCQIEYGSRNMNWGYDARGRICNYGDSGEIYVTCPILRDVDSSSGLNCASVSFHSEGNCSTNIYWYDDWSCIMDGRAKSGKSYSGWWIGWDSIPTSRNWQVSPSPMNGLDNFLWFATNTGPDIGGGNTGGYNTVRCTIPETCSGQGNNTSYRNCLSNVTWAE